MTSPFGLSAPGELLLQRKLIGDGARWRTVVRFPRRDAPQVQRAAELLYGADTLTLWRVVERVHPLRVLAQWDGSSWAV